MNAATDEFTAAVDYLRQDDRFHVVLNYLVESREHQITQLGTYKDESGLRKAAAEITALTGLLDLFGVPTGTVKTATETLEEASQ